VNARRLALLFSFVLFLPSATRAQDFGVLNTAQTINSGNLKLAAFPVFLFGEGDDDIGLSLLGGFGLTDNLDVSGRAAIYDDISFVGVDVEYWFVKGQNIDFSGTLGFHAGLADEGFVDSKGVDVTLIGSREVRPRVEFYGALDLAFNSFDDDVFDDGYTTAHLVPGIEYSIRADIDLVFELGVGLTDDSSNYAAGGIAFYIR
jgi:hypothetical protein